MRMRRMTAGMHIFDEAAQIIVDKEKASIGMLQRYLKVGFNRAARIMDRSWKKLVSLDRRKERNRGKF